MNTNFYYKSKQGSRKLSRVGEKRIIMRSKYFLSALVLLLPVITYGQAKQNYNFNDKVKLTGRISAIAEKNDDGSTSNFTGLKTEASYNVKCLTADCVDFNDQTTFIPYFKSNSEIKKYRNKNVIIYGTFYFEWSHGGVPPEHPYIKIEKISIVK